MQEMLIVTVDDLGQTYVEKEPVTSQQLIGELQVYHQRNPQGLMLLYANRTAVYGDVIQILDLMRSIGGDRVALATLPTTSPNLSNPSSLVNPRNNLINPGSPFTPSNPNFDPNRSFIAPR